MHDTPEYAVPISYYRIRMIVCDMKNRVCRLRLCEKCPSITVLKQFLFSRFEEYGPDDVVEFSQWVTTDRTDLVSQSLKVSELFTC